MDRRADSLVFALLRALLACIPQILWSIFHTIFGRRQKDIKNDIVLVTGSAMGLGHEMAIKFAKKGCEVICVDLNAEENLKTVSMIQDIGGRARAYVCNVADRKAVMQLAKEVGRVDILVNNAGIYPFRNLWNDSEEDIRTIIDVNLLAHFWTIQAFVPGMKERDYGHVVGISSLSAHFGLPYFMPYATTKAGVQGLMNSLYHELKMVGSKVNVTIVYPTFTNTNPIIEECLIFRQRLLEPQYVADVIMRGILENWESFTVPLAYSFISNIARFLPQEGFTLILKYLNFGLTAPKCDEFAELMRKDTYKKDGKLVKQKI